MKIVLKNGNITDANRILAKPEYVESLEGLFTVEQFQPYVTILDEGDTTSPNKIMEIDPN